MNNNINDIILVTNFNANKQNHGVTVCCFVLLLTLGSLWCSSGIYLHDHIKPENSKHYINTHKSSNQSINISLHTAIPHCNAAPAYLISRERGFSDMRPFFNAVQKFGFNINCKYKERKRFGLKVGRRKSGSEHCFKYNNINNTFCHGAQLIFLNNPNRDNFRTKILNLESKTSLHEILTVFCNRYHKNDNVCNFRLLSYNLDIPNERIEFLNKHIDCNNEKPQYDKTWVFKEHIDFGSGVHLINNHQLIYQLITANISENIDNCTFNPIKNKTYFQEEKIVNYHKITDGYVINRTKCLIQTFVANPLLVKLNPNERIKHVFHVRSYFLIPSHSNPLVILHWPWPILFINPNEYNNKQKHLNKESILTNRYIIVHDDIFDDSYAWIWGQTQLQMYLDEEYGSDLFGGNYTMNKLNSDIKHIAETVFHANAYNNKLKQQQIFENENEFRFDIWCMDTIINDKFELKLMEMNAGKCGIFCKPWKIENKKKNGEIYDWDCDTYFSEAAEIVMELSIKKTFNYSIKTIDSANNWEIVFWE